MAEAARLEHPEPPRRRPTKGQRTRARILAAAESVFGAAGYHEASIVDITRAADVALGTFYLYFPSKKEALVELVRTRGHEMRAALARATAGTHDRREAERAGIEAFLSWVAEHPAIYRVVRTAEFADPEVYREWYRMLAEGYADAIGRGRSARARERAEVLAYCAMGAIDYAGLRWVLWGDARVPDRVIDEVVGFVTRGLGLGEGPGAGAGRGR